MRRMDPDLHAATVAAAHAMADHFDVCREYMCQDLSLVGAELLRDAGYDVAILCINAVEFEWGDAGHCWIRTPDGWNIDYSIGQFEELSAASYPFVTYKDWPAAIEFYGKGSAKPELGNGYYLDEDAKVGPPIGKLLEASTLDQLEDMYRSYYVNIFSYYKTVQDFRRAMKAAGHMKGKRIPRIRIPEAAGSGD